jgi:linoleoyl-CoA desaturase
MKIKFQDPHFADYFQVLKQRVDHYFDENKISKNANLFIHIKSFFFLSSQVGLYLAMMSDQFSAPAYIMLYALFGVMTGLMNFNIVHDALHGAYSSNSTVNRYLGYLYDLNGTSSYVWKITHNMIHHTYTNIPGYDGDIDKAIILRLNPKDKLLPFHYYQNLYAFFLYCLVSVNWVLYGDYTFFLSEIKKGKIKLKEGLLFFGFKALNLFLLIILPIIYLHYPFWVILLGYLCGQMAAGFSISLIFQLAHVVENVNYVEPDKSGIIHTNWAAHEMMTTSNFSTRNFFLTHLLGGLNFQVEHHLLPHICHVHYPFIQKIVKDTAREFNLPYHENPTFYHAIKSHYRIIKCLGREECSRYLIKSD